MLHVEALDPLDWDPVGLGQRSLGPQRSVVLPGACAASLDADVTVAYPQEHRVLIGLSLSVYVPDPERGIRLPIVALAHCRILPRPSTYGGVTPEPPVHDPTVSGPLYLSPVEWVEYPVRDDDGLVDDSTFLVEVVGLGPELVEDMRVWNLGLRNVADRDDEVAHYEAQLRLEDRIVDKLGGRFEFRRITDT